MCDIADGACDVWRRTTKKARKTHKCMACRETIEAGHTYEVTESLFDGVWERWKHCLRCSRIFTALNKKAREAHDWIAIEPDLGCGESWESAWGETPPPDVAALAFALPSDFSTGTPAS